MRIIYTKKLEEIMVDDEDYEELNKYSWHLNDNGYAMHTFNPNKVRMHRYIKNLTFKDNKIFIDHINGNKLDNRKENLRLCNNMENLFNRGKNLNNTSGYKGVVWIK